jgi:hypothetical protein
MGAKEVGPGVIVFRYADKLYLLEGTPAPAPTAMKNFLDNWNVSYMKALKDFQDNWNVSCVNAVKNFQDNATAEVIGDFRQAAIAASNAATEAYKGKR